MKSLRQNKYRRASGAAKKRIVTTETTEITKEPKLEIRRPATLAQALTEPAVAVVKEETKITKSRKTRLVA